MSEASQDRAGCVPDSRRIGWEARHRLRGEPEDRPHGTDTGKAQSDEQNRPTWPARRGTPASTMRLASLSTPSTGYGGRTDASLERIMTPPPLWIAYWKREKRSR